MTRRVDIVPHTHWDREWQEGCPHLRRCADTAGDLRIHVTRVAIASRVHRRGTPRADRHPNEPAQRHPAPPVGHQGRRREPGHPKLRHGSFFPSILDRRRRIDRALYAVVMESYVHGVSTRKVDDLVAALGATSGISKSEGVAHLPRDRRDVERVPGPASGPHRVPVCVPDATYIKARSGGRIVSKAVIVATGVSRNGDREGLGVEVGDSEDGAFWIAFLQPGPCR